MVRSMSDSDSDRSHREVAASDDRYSRADYRRLIAWSARIERERPFLLQLLRCSPEPSVVDLGCGSGEHTAFFSQEGARAVGVDRSEAMLASARDHEARGEGRFVLGNVAQARNALGNEAPFGLAICLGNTLPHLLEDEDLEAFVASLCEVLLPGGLFLLQTLNYRRIIDQQIRYLPVNVREGEADEEIVFLRLMKSVSERRILFFPTTLALSVDADAPVSVNRSRRVELRPWTSEDVVNALEPRGFKVELFGDMKGGPFDTQSSHDLIVVATRGLS